MITVDASQFEDLAKKLKWIQVLYPEKVNDYMKRTTKGFQDAVKKEEEPRWSKRIGHDKYTEAEGWKPFRRSRYVKYSDKVIKGVNTWAIINNRRYYERFVNDGHAIRRKKRGPAIGYAKPTHHIDKGVKNYEPTAFLNLDRMVSGLFSEVGL